MSYPCPACGFEVFDEPPGSYDICPICGWEDDEVQLRFPTMRGGANMESLHEFQEHFLRSSPLHETVPGHYRQCPDWRPLTEKECRETAGTPETGREYFDASGAEKPEYYWRTKS